MNWCRNSDYIDVRFLSEEYKDTEGLNLIPGKVVPIPNENNRVPHISWQQLNFTQDINFLNNIPKESFFYFVSSKDLSSCSLSYFK